MVYNLIAEMKIINCQTFEQMTFKEKITFKRMVKIYLNVMIEVILV